VTLRVFYGALLLSAGIVVGVVLGLD
jgi:hypothetical protein